MPKSPDNDMENLSKAIVEAILGSEEVKQALEKMNGSEETAGKNFMVFMVSLDSLAETKSAEKEQETNGLPPEIKKPKRRKVAKKVNLPDLVDGKQLSKNERKFHDYISENFDSDSWLKKLRLRLE